MKVAILTLSDKGYRKEREDLSGKVIEDIVTAMGFEVIARELLPDEEELIVDWLTEKASCVNLILTTGGTGFSKRDVTPEATARVIERKCEGVVYAMIANSLNYSPRAMLTRAVCGIKGDCVILNLPGSPKAVRECLEYVLPPLTHGIEILLGGGECGNA